MDGYMGIFVLLLSYVSVIYLYPLLRHKGLLHRDHPTSIRLRMEGLLLHNTLFCVIFARKRGISELGLMMDLDSIAWMLHTIFYFCMLYLGPISVAILEGESLADVEKGSRFVRAYVFGPFSEELCFRSILLNMLPAPSNDNKDYIVLIGPLFFAAAHIHHIFTLPKGLYSFRERLQVTLFQVMYTYLFGVLATLLFQRTRSIWPCFIAHSFCNIMGVPSTSILYQKPKYFATYLLGVIIFATWIFRM